MAAGAAFAALGGFQLWSGLQQAELIMGSARLTNQINEANARFIELDAYEAEKFGYTQSARYQATIDKVLAQQKSAFAASDTDFTSGVAAELQAETKLVGFLNVIDLQNEARKRALGLKTQASNVRLGIGITNAQAQMNAFAAQVGGITGAARSGLAAYDAGGGSSGSNPHRLEYSPHYTEKSLPSLRYESQYFGSFE